MGMGGARAMWVLTVSRWLNEKKRYLMPERSGMVGAAVSFKNGVCGSALNQRRLDEASWTTSRLLKNTCWAG
jgi:hypothetical protein